MQNNYDIEETKRRLAHLASMPETLSRRLEMTALRRVLEMDVKPVERSRREPTGVKKRNRAEVPDTPDKTSREVNRTSDGRKRIVIRKKTVEKKELKDEGRDDRERMKRLKDFGNTLNQGF